MASIEGLGKLVGELRAHLLILSQSVMKAFEERNALGLTSIKTVMWIMSL